MWDGKGPMKARFGLVPPHAEAEVVRVLTLGAVKHSDEGWRKVPDLRKVYLEAAMRHVNAYRRGERVDAADGTHPLANAITDLYFILEADLTGIAE